VDPLFDTDNVRRLSSKFGAVDVTLVSTSGAPLASLSHGKPGRFGFLPNPVDASIESGRNHERANLPHTLFYVCGTGAMTRNILGQDQVMDSFLTELDRRLPTLNSLYGGCMGRPYLTGAAYQAALESAAIGLNISRRNDVPLYSSDRVAHMIGNGQVLAIERATGYGTLFGEDELLFFSSHDELIGKLAALHADDAQRRKLAANGYRRYYDLFNERRVARYLVDAAFGRVEPADYEWPTLI
ncbi:MAG TPA: glycosyltransferase, partial [Stellaceae bacterium]|nr:glycosyltransferase [Stellaceae bacterium]